MSHISYFERSIRALIAVIAFPFSIFEFLLSKYQLAKNKPIGMLIRINKRQIHVNVTGENKQHSPTVILESGMGGSSLDWSLVQPELSKHTKVLSYDRAGFGWSTDVMNQATCESYVNELRLIIKELKIEPPYILVGHSYGGMIMRLFASKYSDEVQGIVLVDSAHEDRYLEEKFSKQRRHERKINLRAFRLGYLLSPIGLPRLIKRHIGVKRLPLNIQKKVIALGSRAGAFKAAYLELLGTTESAIELKQASGLPDDMAVIVLSAGKQTEEWKKSQNDLLNLTKQTKQIWVNDSWHAIQVYQPDAVVSAVKSLLML